MQIQFKGTNYELASDMTELAERKFGAMKKFIGKPEKPAIAYIDLGKETEAHQNGAVWYAEANVEVDGTRYTAKAKAENLRSAIDKASKELSAELRTAKKKRETLERKKGGRFKEFFRFGR